MRILNNQTGASIREVTLYLTLAEAEEMAASIKHLADTPENHHVHINDSEYEREITITIYRPDNLDEFDDRSRELIQKGV